MQGTVELEVEEIERALNGAGGQATDWRVLAQVDSDETAEMMWGDVGDALFHDPPRRSPGTPIRAGTLHLAVHVARPAGMIIGGWVITRLTL